MKHLDNEIKIKVQNNIIKSIATSNLNKNIIFEGSYALYKILQGDINSDVDGDRVFAITDLDIDTYGVVEKLWEKTTTDYEAKPIIDSFVKEKVVKVFDNKHFKSINVFSDFVKIWRYNINNRTVYKINFVVNMIDIETNKEFDLKVDLLFVKNPYNHSLKNISIDGVNYSVMVYEIEKYYVGKIYSLLKHYGKFAKQHGGRLDKIKTLYPKLITIYKDIMYIRRFYPLEQGRIEFYINEFYKEEYGEKEDIMFIFKEIIDKLQKELKNDKSKIR